MTPDILITLDWFAALPDHAAIVERIRTAGYTVALHHGGNALTERQVSETLPGVRATIVGNDVYTHASLAAGDKLEIVCRAGVGYDSIDVAACTQHGVAVTNAPASNAAAVAEFALALMFALSRKMVLIDRAVRRGVWERKDFEGDSPLTKTLGIVGMGNIGKRLARLSLALGITTQYYDILGAIAPPDLPEARFVPMDELLRTSDVISLHVPLDAGTRHLIGAPQFACMKPSAYLITTSRGGVVDEAALEAALDARTIAGAALDVFAPEPIRNDHPLLDRDDVILTMHIAGMSIEAKQNMAWAAAEAAIVYLDGGRPNGLINPEVLTARAGSGA